ncbi:hypothetical protein L218DRAFT_1008656 [Marasmius fiardii PR-910]|nr:hypothetical protein L218DRAFT_1008656 [Marasmius fiardii PR-910]
MSAPFHVDRPVAESAMFYAKLQPLLANFTAWPCGPCKPMLERFLIQHGSVLEKAYAFESKVPASQAFVWSIVYTINAHLTHVLPSTSLESRCWSVCDHPHSSWILTEAEKEIMMVAKARVLDVNFSAAKGEAPPTAGPVPDDTSLPTTRSRVAKGKGKVATSTPPPSTSQKIARKPCILESEDDKLDQIKTSPKTKPSTPSGSGKPNTGKGKTGGPRAKPKDPPASSKDKKRAHSPSPERTAPKPNKKSKKTINIAAPPPETSGIPKWGDPRLKLSGKWPKGQEGMVEQDPDNLADSRPHICDDLDLEFIKKSMADVSSTIALPGSIRASLASLAYGATSIRFTGPHSRSLPCTKCYEKPQECTGPSGAASKCDHCMAKWLSCSNNLPKNSLNAFLEVAAQNGMSSQTMIERLLTEIDFHWEQVFDLDHAIFRLERLKKKTITAHDIAQDTLKASCQDPCHIIHLLKTTDTSFKMTPAQVDMLIACLGWESVNFSIEASRTPEGDPMVRNSEGRETVFLAPDSMTAVPRNPLSDSADLFSAAGDAQVATSSDATHRQPINLGGGIVVTEQSEAPSDAPPTNPFANPDTFVISPTDLDPSLSEEGETREVPAAEELV